MRCQQKACGEAAERAEGKGEADFIVQLGDGRAGGDIVGLVEVVVVLEEGEAAALLGVLEEGFGGEGVVVDAGEVLVGRDEGGDEGVVLGGEAELPASPMDAAAGSDVAGGDGAYRLHTEGFADKLEACGEVEDAVDGSVDDCAFADGEHGCS